MYKPGPRLQIRNFGPIARGTVHLRPFTVFAGPGNSGKSCLTTLVHALHSFFAGDHRPGVMGPGLFRGHGLEALNYLVATREVFPSVDRANAVAKWAERTLATGDDLARNGSYVQVPLSPPVVECVNRLLAASGHLFTREFAYCMGITNVQQFRKANSRQPTQLSVCGGRKEPRSGRTPPLKIMLQDSSWEFKVESPRPAGEAEVSFDAAEYGHFRNRASRAVSAPPDELDVAASELVVLLAESILKTYMRGFGHQSYYFPASRHGAAILYKTVVREAVNRRGASEGSPHIPGTTSDFVSMLLDVGNAAADERGQEEGEVTSIEKNILEGTMEVVSNRVFGLHDFRYRPGGNHMAIPLERVASTVSSLAPVALCVRYLATSGSVLIIEEPEAHVHPRKQVALTRELAQLVKRGIHVVVTTHSEWILEELTNIVRRSSMDKDGSEPESIDRVSLTKAEVGVWHFRNLKRGHGTKVVRALRGANGLYDVGFYDVALDVYDEWLRTGLEPGDAS